MRVFNQVLFMMFLVLILLTDLAGASRLELQKVTDSVYAVVGDMAQRSKKNLGNNATFGFVVTSDGVVLMDSGGGYQAAEQLQQIINSVTDKPVKYVINLGGQDHRWFGNDYFKRKGAVIIASVKAVADQKKRARDQYIMMSNLVGDKILAGTRMLHADKVFESKMEFMLGGIKFIINQAPHAHTPGDSYVWLPEKKVVFAGDIIYVERMLAVGSMSNIRQWIKAFTEITALKPRYIVPGHGHATSLSVAKKDTYNYLVFLYNGVKKLYENGLTEDQISSFDQSSYSYLHAYKELKGRNALRVYMELEYESLQ